MGGRLRKDRGCHKCGILIPNVAINAIHLSQIIKIVINVKGLQIYQNAIGICVSQSPSVAQETF